MTIIDKAYLVAKRAHQNQTYDMFPYEYHVREVAGVAEELGFSESVIVGCILHDVLEDSDLSYNDLKKTFGKEIAEIAYCVTDELGRNRKERKEKTYPKIKSNPEAALVKICDRIANTKHSKLYNEGLYKMYKRELPTFVKELNNLNYPERVLAMNKLMSL